jgi:hypothetical protein
MQDDPLVRALAEACGLLGECFGIPGEGFYVPDPDGSVRLYGQEAAFRPKDRPMQQPDDGKC